MRFSIKIKVEISYVTLERSLEISKSDIVIQYGSYSTTVYTVQSIRVLFSF